MQFENLSGWDPAMLVLCANYPRCVTVRFFFFPHIPHPSFDRLMPRSARLPISVSLPVQHQDNLRFSAGV